jgi:hypothetical protein
MPLCGQVMASVRLSDKARELGYEDGDYSEMPKMGA